MEQAQQPRAALFIDAENLVIGTQKLGLPLNVKAVVDRVREEGMLSFAKAYADWTQHPLLGYVMQFHDNVIELTQLSSIHGKNTADIQIVVDAVEMALSHGTPEIFVLVAGDRDFVPLAQKLKRYGKRVVGMGLQETTSPALRNACDAFLFYDHLQPIAAQATSATPPSRGIASEPVPEDLQEAFGVLLRAVLTLERKGETPTGANTRPLMQQLDSAFDLSRFQFVKFAEFVEAAVAAGYVNYGPKLGEHFSLQSPPAATRPALTRPISFITSTVFQSDAEALQAYREILARKRVPLIPWRERQILIKHLWDVLAEKGALAWPELQDVLVDGAGRNMMNLPREVLYKQLMTLSLAECFERRGYVAKLDMYSPEPVSARCSYEEALSRTATAYVIGIRDAEPTITLRERALALLLFDKDGEAEIRETEAVIRRLSGK